MEKVITVDIADKNDLVEKYDRSIVSADLIKFILTQAEQASIRDTFKIIVKDKCHLDHDVSNLILLLFLQLLKILSLQKYLQLELGLQCGMQLNLLYILSIKKEEK